MKKITLFALTLMTAVIFAACGGTAENKPAVKTEPAKPAAAPPSIAALLDMEKKAGEAWSKNDSKYFEGFLTDNYVGFYNGKHSTKADDLKMIAETKCDIKSMALTEEKMVPVGPDAAVLVTKSTTEGTCGGQKVPSPAMAATLFVRSGDSWKAAYHNEVAIVAPKAAPASDAADDQAAAAKQPAKAADTKAADTKAAVKTADAKQEAAKKDAVAKKEAGEEVDTKKADPSALALDPTASDDALAKILLVSETAGWEAWKARDADKLGSLMTNDATFIDPMGGVKFGKADNLSNWSQQKCEVKSVSLSDGKAYNVLTAVSILTFKATVDGTCDGEKLTPIWGTGIYFKEGENWKLAFHLEDLVKK